MLGNEARTVSQFRRLATAQEDDALLLNRFLADTDADAFAELVRRHGPMVLGVCRRVLGSGPDADDAFQAAFLVLARKAGSVRNAGSVASWLFGVARFAALRARDKERRRREHEANVVREPRPQPDPELLAALDEELQRLPDRYRAPLVACFLQGRTQEDAAKDAGCSVSTLRRRLEQGQELLRRRLTGRGAVPALGALATGVGGASVSATTVEATTALAVAFLNGKAGAIPATALATGVLTMMWRAKLKTLVAAVLVVAALAGGGIAWQLAAAQPPAPVPANDAAQPPKADPNRPPKPAEPTPKAEKPPAADKIKVGDRLKIHSENTFEEAKLTEVFEVEASGKIALGPRYGGRVKIDGLTLEEAEAVIQKQVRQYAKVATITLVRYVPLPDSHETRIRVLEQEVKELRAVVEELRKKKP